MKKGWKKGWLCRDWTGGLVFFSGQVRPRKIDASRHWEVPKNHWGKVSPFWDWILSDFRARYKCNFPFPAKGSIHRVEMEF